MRNKKIFNKLLSFICILAITCTFLLPSSVSAEENAKQLGNETKSTQIGQARKAEVVYASLDNNGTTKDIYVVNNFPAQTNQQLIDYGDYTQIEDLALSGSAKLEQGQVEINKVAENYYYKGKLNSQELPWNFEITYSLDGQKVSSEELADKSGEFELTIEIKTNPKLKGNVWAENLMLQITVQLPNDIAQNVKSDQGIVAEAGSNKLITFMILPKAEMNEQSKQYSLRADVQHFSMPSIQIAASPFSLNMFQFDLPDLSENQDIKKFQAAVEQLATGSKALSDGVSKLNDGKQKLADNLELINSSGKDLTNGGTDLQTGIQRYMNGVDQISAQNQKLSDGAIAIQQAADQILDGFQGLSAGVELIKGSEEIKNGLTAMQAGTNQFTAEQINVIKTQLNALPDQVVSFQQSITELMNGLTEISNHLNEIISGLNGLQTALARESILGQLGIAEADIATNQEAQSILAYVDNVRTQSLPGLIDGLTGINQGLAAMQNSDALSKMNNALNNLSQLSQLSGLFGLLEGINQLNSQYALFHSGLYEYVQGLNQLSKGFYNKNSSVQSFYPALSRYLQGVQKYMGGVSTLSDNGGALKSGLTEYVNGTDQYVTGVKRWSDGFDTFASGINSLKDGALELSDGTAQLSGGTQKMDEMLNQMINSYLADYDHQVDIPSFASSKNEIPETVQFVFMTEAIDKKKTEKAVEPAEESETFWERLFNLFR